VRVVANVRGRFSEWLCSCGLSVTVTVTVHDSEWEAELETYGSMKPRLTDGG
jgi:hypothetical protein